VRNRTLAVRFRTHLFLLFAGLKIILYLFLPRHSEERSNLFYCNGLAEVAGLVNVAAAKDGNVVGEQLKADDGEQGRQGFVAGRDFYHRVGYLVAGRTCRCCDSVAP